MGIPVVRAIVPGLETFEVAKLFTSTELFMGRRAKSYFENILFLLENDFINIRIIETIS